MAAYLELQVTLNGRLCLQLDADDLLSSHVEKYLQMIYRGDGGNAGKSIQSIDDSYCASKRPLPIPSVPPEPKLGINQLYVPIGMHRWTKVHVAVDQKTFESVIRQQAGALPSVLKINNFQINLWVIGECRISTGIASEDDSVWILTLADSRYWAQFAPAPAFTEGLDSWSELFTELKAAFGAKPHTLDISTNYSHAFDVSAGIGQPDMRYLNRPGESLALIYDIARWSYHLQIFAPTNIDFSFSALSQTLNAGSKTQPSANTQTTIQNILHFNKYFGDEIRKEYGPHVVENGGTLAIAAARRALHCSEHADLANDVDGTPSNHAFLTSLATYYGGLNPAVIRGNFSADQATSYDTSVSDIIVDFSRVSPGVIHCQSMAPHELYIGQIFVVENQREESCKNDDFVWVKNVDESETDAPPYGIVQPIGALLDGSDPVEINGSPVIRVKKWDGNYLGPFLWIKDSAVPFDEIGKAQLPNGLTKFLYKSGITPTNEMCLGPELGQWWVKRGTHAIRSVGPYNSVSLVGIGIPAVPQGFFFKAPSGGIPGRAANLLGGASCTVFSTGATSLTLSSTGIIQTVKNWSTTAACVNGDRYGFAMYWQGSWWVVAEDCGNTSTGGVGTGFSLLAGTPVENPIGTPQSGLSTISSTGLVPAWLADLGV